MTYLRDSVIGVAAAIATVLVLTLPSHAVSSVPGGQGGAVPRWLIFLGSYVLIGLAVGLVRERIPALVGVLMAVVLSAVVATNPRLPFLASGLWYPTWLMRVDVTAAAVLAGVALSTLAGRAHRPPST